MDFPSLSPLFILPNSLTCTWTVMIIMMERVESERLGGKSPSIRNPLTKFYHPKHNPWTDDAFAWTVMEISNRALRLLLTSTSSRKYSIDDGWNECGKRWPNRLLAEWVIITRSGYRLRIHSPHTNNIQVLAEVIKTTLARHGNVSKSAFMQNKEQDLQWLSFVVLEWSFLCVNWAALLAYIPLDGYQQKLKWGPIWIVHYDKSFSRLWCGRHSTIYFFWNRETVEWVT